MHGPTSGNRGGIPDPHSEERVSGQPSLRCFVVASVIRDAGARVLWPGRGCGPLTAIQPCWVQHMSARVVREDRISCQYDVDSVRPMIHLHVAQPSGVPAASAGRSRLGAN